MLATNNFLQDKKLQQNDFGEDPDLLKRVISDEKYIHMHVSKFPKWELNSLSQWMFSEDLKENVKSDQMK